MTIILILAILVSVGLGILMVRKDRDEIEELEISPDAKCMRDMTKRLNELWSEYNQTPGKCVWASEAIMFEIKGVEMRMKHFLIASHEKHTL